MSAETYCQHGKLFGGGCDKSCIALAEDQRTIFEPNQIQNLSGENLSKEEKINKLEKIISLGTTLAAPINRCSAKLEFDQQQKANQEMVIQHGF